VLLGVGDCLQARRQFGGARRGLRQARLPPLLRERRRQRAQRLHDLARGIGERRVRGQPVGALRGPQDLGERREGFLAAPNSPTNAFDPARVRTSSCRASRNNSSLWRLPKRAPKNCVARSGI
jgi:hypothetical protein